MNYKTNSSQFSDHLPPHKPFGMLFEIPRQYLHDLTQKVSGPLPLPPYLLVGFCSGRIQKMCSVPTKQASFNPNARLDPSSSNYKLICIIYMRGSPSNRVYFFHLSETVI